MKFSDQVYFWVAEAVAEHDGTQKNLALRLGISEKHLSQVMQRKAGLSPEKLDHLAAITGRKWSVTFDSVGEPQPEPCTNPECDGGYVPVRLERTGTTVDFDPCPSCVPPETP